MAVMGSPVSRIVVAGTGTSYLWLRASGFDPRVEASPGTFVFSDWNYHHRFAEMGMKPAAVLLTRVISKPKRGRFTCDLGCKAVASDPLLENRVHFLDIMETKIVRQSEEHLVVESPMADELPIGRMLYALPYHICPSIPLHRELLVVEHARVCGAWQVAARDRVLRR
jgi:D-serine deaminase-like pyridoxal phosphate-dependent protein